MSVRGITNHFSPQAEIIGGGTIAAATTYIVAASIVCPPAMLAILTTGVFFATANTIRGMCMVKLKSQEVSNQEKGLELQENGDNEHKKSGSMRLWRTATIISGALFAIPLVVHESQETFVHVARMICKFAIVPFAFSSISYLTRLS